MFKLKKLFALLLIACVTSVSANAAIFLNIPGVEGESVDAQHSKEIDVLAWSWGATSTSGSTCIGDISLVKNADIASPTLLMNQAQGLVYPTATLSVATRGELSFDYIVLEFKNLFVSALSTGGSGGDDRITESVSFSFEEVKYTYTPQKNDGSLGDPVSATIRASKNCK